MGEVYKAHDPRLGRDVAIKIASEAFSDRSAREARAVAALSHTNICHLYDVGPDYLVMEFVEGRILQGPLDFEEALPIIRQLIDGIEAAHERNIVHRDLKPANIKITPDGIVKILDFGLAKAIAPEALATDVTNSPTIAFPAGATGLGTVVGTSAYMAPEQAKGKQADKRADIWAFGVIVYELLTGRGLFGGDTAIEILGEVLNKTPDLSAVPPRARRLLAWCLEKDRKDRLQAIGDARRLLEEEPAPVAVATTPSRWGSVRWAVACLAVIGVATIAGAVAWFAYPRLNPQPALVTRFQIEAPEGTSLTSPLDVVNSGAVSPDGTRLVFAARDAAGKLLLWIRPFDTFSARPLTGTDNGALPFWSPDSRFIGFFADRKLKKIDASGGPPQTICDVPSVGVPRGGTWGTQGVVLFAESTGPIYRVPPEGGQPKAVTQLDSTRREASHRFPSFLPDGRSFLYLALAPGDIRSRLFVATIEGGAAVHLLDADTNAIYAPPGFLLFEKEGTLVRQLFDATTHELSGPLVPVAERVAWNAAANLGGFSASPAGVLTFRSGSNATTQFTWFDRTGKMLGTVGPPGVYSAPALSPDEKRLAFRRMDQQTAGDIWVLDLARQALSRFTFSPRSEWYPIWSPDASQIVFSSDQDGSMRYYRRNASGIGTEEPMTKTGDGAPNTISGAGIPAAISPDGSLFLHFEGRSGPTGTDIFVMPLTGDRTSRPVVQTPFTDAEAMFSRDGRWLAYTSNETGRYELYVQAFPSTGGRWQISSAGGRQPAWRGDGKELFFSDDEGRLYAVDVNGSGKSFEFGVPHMLFQMRTDVAANVRNSYVVTNDGQRFLVNALLDSGTSPINVVVNWPASLPK